MRTQNKRWLISMLKTSGSKRDHILNGRFADDRNTKKYVDIENLPGHESIKKTRQFYNSKINTDLLKRFLRGQIGKDWDAVYSETINRIPTRLLDYKEIALWYVADKVEFKDDGQLWNKRSQKYIYTGGEFKIGAKHNSELIEFYVDPSTNKLTHNPHRAFKKVIAANRENAPSEIS